MMNISRILRPRSNITSSVLPSLVPFSTGTSDETIVIPKRIQRGPTDILRALESTVGRDPTAAHYKYHDDPFLIPFSSSGKRVFALAQESGRKAAHWVRKEHADLFQHQEAEPMIEAFVPPMVYTEQSEVQKVDLEKLVALGQVDDAKIVYGILKAKGEVDAETELGVLELLCYRNEEEGVMEEFIEERWFKAAGKGKDVLKKIWKDGQLAETIFENMDPKTPSAYCAIIQGMAKYGQVDRALHHFEECQKTNTILNTSTFNSLISVVNIAKESAELRWGLVTSYLRQMNEQKLKPNLGTLNAILYSLSFMGNQKITKEYTLKTLAEFKKLGIEPSLASWYYVILTFCKERGPVSTILYDIMNVIENKNYEIRDLKDVHFFVTAMEMARHHLNDVNLAKRIDTLLHFGDNYNLVGDSYKESVYYRHYFALLCANLPVEEFMNDVYFKLVPHIYVPEMGIMAEVLNLVDANGAVAHIPKLWSDIVIFDHAHRENLIEILTNSMVNNEPLLTAELNEKFGDIAWDIYSKSLNQDDFRTARLNLTGDLLGKILILLVRRKDFNKACTIMNKLEKEQQKIPGVPRIEALSLFVDLCIEEKSPSRAISCIQYISDCGFPEAKALAIRLHKKLNLDEVFLGELTKIVGDINE